MKAIVVAITLFLSGVVCAQSAKPINAKLQKATVYLQGAHLYYTENITLAAGNNDIVFENISPYINPSSLQAGSKGGVVMDVQYTVKYKERTPVTKQYDREIAHVLDSIDDVNYEIKDADNRLRVLATEKNMLLNNPIMQGKKDSLPLLKQGMEFLEEKLNSIYAQELKWERTKTKAETKRTRLNERYNTLLLLQSGENGGDMDAQPIPQVVITLFAETPGPAQVNFNYFIQNAAWVPMYDLQATSLGSTLQMKYFANVTQNSGLDWKNTLLTLSTSTPAESNMKPVLPPWYLSYMNYLQEFRDKNALSNAPIQLQSKTDNVTGSSAEMLDLEKSMLDFVTVSENLIRVEYEIKLNYTINSDGKAHKVLINERDVPMGLEFAAVPKLSADAFLMARLTGWEDMNIIPGNARLYFDGSYVGEVYLNAFSTDDTLKVNLGRDKSIAITRKKIKEKSKERFLGSDKVETRSIEIVVRNTKNVPMDIEIEDQVPVVAMGNNDIKVVLKEGDGATLDEPTGKLTWKLKLKAKESKKIVFTYEIQYPKDKPIAGL